MIWKANRIEYVIAQEHLPEKQIQRFDTEVQAAIVNNTTSSWMLRRAAIWFRSISGELREQNMKGGCDNSKLPYGRDIQLNRITERLNMCRGNCDVCVGKSSVSDLMRDVATRQKSVN